MPRLARRSAGSGVLDLVEALSDDLLVEEQSAFAGIEVPFAQAQSDVESLTVAALKRRKVEALKDDDRWLAGLSDLCGEAILGCDEVVLGLHARAWSLTRLSIEDQLVLCERTLPKRLAGVARDGCSAADVAKADLLGEASRAWGEGRVAALGALGFEAARQIDMATLYDKAAPERTLGRFTSPDVLSIQGCQGRGAWWRPVATLQRYARESCIGLANRISQTATAGMNEAARARG